MTGKRRELLSFSVAREEDVFLARQRGREVAALAGLENQDQVRVATALSELSREFAVRGCPAAVTLSLVGSGEQALQVAAKWSGPLPGAGADLLGVPGFAAAARLMDTRELSSTSEGGSVVLTKRLPAGAQRMEPSRAADVRERLRTGGPGTTLEGVGSQNRDLLETLDSLNARQEELLRANAELEETNRGVVALYAELDEATSRLREASEAKTRFWASISHELRTPVNSVLGLSRLLLDAGSDPLTTEQREQVELVRDSGAMLLGLVNELLDVAKAESGRVEVHAETTDLRAVFDRLRGSLAPTVTSPDVTLVVEDPVDVGAIWTDPTLLGRILLNLVSNAVKFTERGEVRCLARSDGPAGAVLIQVADTGIGIAPEHQAQVFEDFYQVPGRRRAGTPGTGLGLPYARRLAGILGGSLDLRSAPGRGTTVTLTLPHGEAVEAPPSRFASVLVVDDDPVFRTVLRGALGDRATAVREAADGAAALRVLRADPPDLVLLDLDIPPPRGPEVLAGMRRDPVLGAVPVVIVTSAAIDSTERATLGATAAILNKGHVSARTVLAAAEAARTLAGGPR